MFNIIFLQGSHCVFETEMRTKHRHEGCDKFKESWMYKEPVTLNETEDPATLSVREKTENPKKAKESDQKRSNHRYSKENSESTVNQLRPKENVEEKLDKDEHPKVNNE